MKTWVIDQNQNAVVSQAREKPVAGSQQVLVAVKAVSLNYHDLLALQARGTTPRSDLIAGTDFAGEIVALGEEVNDWAVGDRVCGGFYPYWHEGDIVDGDLRVGGDDIDGVMAEYLLRSPQSLVAIPDALSYAEASTLPCAALTAWSGLTASGAMVGAGQTVLTLGTGGVSLFALQLARAAGTEVIVTSSSDDKLARASKLGATATINYRQHEDWDKQVLDVTQGRGVDLVIETGGSGTFQRSLASARMGGTLSLIGMVDMTPSTVTPFDVFFKNLHVHGIRVGNTAQLRDMNAFMQQHTIEPVIDKQFDFDALSAAYGYLKSSQHFGKVVIIV